MGVMTSAKRREIAFVRALISGKTTYLSDGGLYKIDGVKRNSSLSKERVNKLISDGVISLFNDEIKSNDLSKNWLKRQMAFSSEGFSEQHQNIKIDSFGKKINLNESVLSRLCVGQKGKAPYLEQHHIEAGKRFSMLYQRAGLRSRVSMSYGNMNGANSKKTSFKQNDISDMAIDARKEIDRVLDKLPSDCFSVIVDVCGMEKGLQLVESERGWPRRSAKLVLRIALEQLAAVYGFSSVAVGGRGRGVKGGE